MRAASVMQLAFGFQLNKSIFHIGYYRFRHIQIMMGRKHFFNGKLAIRISEFRYATGSVEGKYANNVPIYTKSPVNRYPLSFS